MARLHSHKQDINLRTVVQVDFFSPFYCVRVPLKKLSTKNRHLPDFGSILTLILDLPVSKLVSSIFVFVDKLYSVRYFVIDVQVDDSSFTKGERRQMNHC